MMYEITSAFKAKLSITNQARTQAKLEKALFFSGMASNRSKNWPNLSLQTNKDHEP